MISRLLPPLANHSRAPSHGNVAPAEKCAFSRLRCEANLPKAVNGASRPFPFVLAKVPLVNLEWALSLGGGDRCACLHCNVGRPRRRRSSGKARGTGGQELCGAFGRRYARVLGQVVCDREPGRLVDGTQKVLAGFPHREKGLGRPNHLSSHTSSKRQPL